MSRIKDVFLYVLAIIVLQAPAIILGWVGLSLLGWVGLIVGIIVGEAVFAFSVNKIAAQEEEAEAPVTVVEGETATGDKMDLANPETVAEPERPAKQI